MRPTDRARIGISVARKHRQTALADYVIIVTFRLLKEVPMQALLGEAFQNAKMPSISTGKLSAAIFATDHSAILSALQLRVQMQEVDTTTA